MRIQLIIALVGLGPVSACPAWCDDRKDIEVLYGKLKQALVTNRFEDTLALETKDFAAAGEKGKAQTGPEFVDELKKNAPMFKLGVPEFRISKCKINGKSAEVDASFVLSNPFVDTRGDNGPKGQSHTMEIVRDLHNTLIKTPDGWKFKSLKQVGTEKFMMDGKELKRKKISPAAGGKRQ